ncbi:hypothetical protein ACLB2K_022452 [Fragaria x ananassa]
MRPCEDTFPSLLPVQPRICHRDSPHPRSRSFPSLSLSLTASVNPYLTNLDEIKQGIMLGRGDRARRFAASSFGALFICSGTETLRDRVKDTGEHLTVYNHCCSTMTSDYAFTQEELNISDGVGYPNAYAELCRHCRAGLYSHGPPFTFMPYCLQQQQWFQKRHKKAMTEALEKIKAELMLLGFVSLLLTVGT